MKNEKVAFPEGGMAELVKQGTEFVKSLDDLIDESDNLSPYELCDALELPRQGLLAAQTTASMAIDLAFKTGNDTHPGMKTLFMLGINLGLAYARLTPHKEKDGEKTDIVRYDNPIV